MRTRLLLTIWGCRLLAACSGGSSSSPADAGADGAMDATTDVGPADTGTPPIPTPPVPDFALGEAIDTAPLGWTWVPFPDSHCMDGSPFGIGVNDNPDSENVLIFFEGGNLCFDPVSCIGVANPDGFTESKLLPNVRGHEDSLFSRDPTANPFGDWSYVYIPYCSGDLHLGNTRNGYHQPGWDQPNQHLGFANTRQFLERVVATYGGAQKVVVAGESAGSFGAIGNFDQVATAFQTVGDPALYLIDDSGPTMSNMWLKSCFQDLVIGAFGFRDTPLAEECPDCLNPEAGGLGEIIPFLTARYPDARMALTSPSSAADSPRTSSTWASPGRTQVACPCRSWKLTSSSSNPARTPCPSRTACAPALRATARS